MKTKNITIILCGLAGYFLATVAHVILKRQSGTKPIANYQFIVSSNSVRMITIADIFRHEHGATSVWVITCDNRLRHIAKLAGQTNYTVSADIDLMKEP